MLCVSLPVACGDSEDNPVPNPNVGGEDGEGGSGASAGEGPGPIIEGGSGGAPGGVMLPGTTTMSETIECDEEPMCESTPTFLPTLFINSCCAADGSCGVSTEFLSGLGTFDPPCQPKGQEGDLDASCPDSAAQMVPVGAMMYPVAGFKGCCRAATGTCGVIVDKITSGPIEFADFGLGCTDSAPFFEGAEGAPCGEGTGGSGAGGSGAGGGGAGPTEPVGGGGAGG